MATEWNFDYTSTEQSVTLKPGKYKLECWGAGASTIKENDYDIYPSYGGYSCGELILKKETILYIYVGQYGNGANAAKFIFNGGGKGLAGRGGGATDIRLIGGEWDNERGLLSRIIVAGGAGFGSGYSYSGSHGGGLKGNNGGGFNNSYTVGATQFDGGRGNGGNKDYLDGFFGKGGSTSTDISNVAQCGGGGGWFGGAGSSTSSISGGGGSGYVLTKDSYKPTGYIPTSEYWLENIAMTVGGNTTKSTGYAKITLLQALPFLNISSYNSTQAIFKADHTDPTLLTKIEYFIDDILKETITEDLTTEKTINYTLEDNALHTLKIVVTDSANATVEKVLSISKNIMPLPEENINLNDISTKLVEVNSCFKSGKTNIINTLALKNIEASLNNTLVELSEKIKVGFDSGDASVEELQNIITQKNNTISQLNTQLGQRKRWAKGIFDQTKITNDRTTIPMNLSFTPTIIFVTCGIEFNFDYASALRCNLKFFTNLVKTNPTALKGNDENFSGIVLASIEGISRSSFVSQKS
ncbi:glycine rich domain-containing protein [Clostridioides difficile]|uniref:glycine rich domain-containing protein n=1 Tax=Clostridioides difficile TaxID=1496 RepID=UPI0020C343E6|nr:glycine rich domain-containing protein [Clostridioides difficile]MCP8370268.1 glycine rich domain-containing protein [Clostridioides difficile]